MHCLKYSLLVLPIRRVLRWLLCILAPVAAFSLLAGASFSSPSIPYTAVTSCQLWMATGRSVECFHPTTYQISQALLPAETFNALASDPQDDTLWILSPSTLSKFDTNGSRLLQLDLRTLGLDNPNLLELNPYDSSLWMADGKSLWHLDREGKLISSWQSPHLIQAISLDIDESLWILTNTELLQLAPSNALLSTLPLDELLNEPRYLALDQVGRRLNLADANQAIQFDLKNPTAPPRRLDLKLSPIETAEKGIITAVSTDPLVGTLWILKADKLLIYDRDAKFLKRVDLHSYNLGALKTLVFTPAQADLWIVGKQALGQFRGDGEFIAQTPLTDDLNALGVAPFKLLPRISLLAPLAGSESHDSLPIIRYGLGGDCMSSLCLPDSDYIDSFDFHILLNKQSLGPPFSRSSFEAIFTSPNYLRAGPNHLTAQATDRYGHASSVLENEFIFHAPSSTKAPAANTSHLKSSPSTTSHLSASASLTLDNATALTSNTDNGPNTIRISPGNPPALETTTTTLQRVVPAKVFGGIPLSFELNQGQTHASVKFLTRAAGHAVFFTHGETVMVLRNPKHKSSHQDDKPLASLEKSGARASATRAPTAQGAAQNIDSLTAVSESGSVKPEPESATLRMKLMGAQSMPKMEGLEPLITKSNYLIGNDPAKWITNVPHYAKIKYHDVYPGIDQIFYGKEGALEYDLVVQPGADPAQIKLVFEGTEPPNLNAEGDLILKTPVGPITHRKPLLYQNIGGQHRTIAGHYVMQGSGEVGIEVKDYDPTQPLVIDPVLSYATYLGGTNADTAYAVTLDAQSSTYVTGSTSSFDFPLPAGVPVYRIGQPGNVFIAKLNATGAAVYVTYLGGSCNDVGRALSVDVSGAVYVTGATCSSNFPVTAGVIQPTKKGATTPSSTYNSFVAKLAADGSHLIYATYLGGSSSNGDQANGIAIDASGNAFVVGTAYSTDFPTTSGAFQIAKGSTDTTLGNAFVVKLNSTATSLLYSTYMGGTGTYTGGSGDDEGAGIVLDTAGNAYVTGTARSANFPTTAGSFQTIRGGYADAYAAKFGPTGALIYGTLLGGSQSVPDGGTVNADIGVDQGKAIALDGQGNAIIVGLTNATNFPTLNAFQSRLAGTNTVYNRGTTKRLASNAFVAKLNSAGSALGYATYLGGGTIFCCSPNYQPLDMNVANSVATDSNGNTYVAGTTYADGFPLRYGIGTSFQYNQRNAFAAAFDTNGNIQYSVAIGSASAYNTDAYGVAVGAIARVTVVGSTTNPSFPITSNALQPMIGNTVGYPSAYIARIDSTTTNLTSSATTINAGQAVTFTATVTGNTPIGGSVIFKDGGATLATVSLVSGSAALTISTLAVGAHSITASYSGDSNNNNPSASAPISVTVNAGPPTVSITSPTNGAAFTVPATIAVTATASSSAGYISKLDFFDGGTLLSTYTAPANTASVTYTLTLTGVTAGSHSYTVKATDSLSAATTSSPVTVTVNYPPPTVSLTAPTNGTLFMAPALIALQATAASPNGSVTRVEFFQGSTFLGAVTATPYNFFWNNVAAGTYSLTAKVIDSVGAAATSAPVLVTVAANPTVAVTNLTNGATVANDTVTITGTVQAPPNSSITVNGVVGSIAANGSFTVNNVALTSGSNTLTATITTLGGQSSAQTLNITSTGPSPFVLAASPTQGMAPLTTNLTVTNRGNANFHHADIYCSSAGAVSTSIPAASLASTAISCTYNTPGSYTVKVNIMDASQPAQILYSYLQSIQVNSVVGLNPLLQTVYFGMLDQLKARNVNGALNYLTATVNAKYAPIFTAMMSSPTLAADLDQLKNIQDGRIGDGYAEFLVVRTINGTPTGFFIYLIQGEDGIWRIDGM